MKNIGETMDDLNNNEQEHLVPSEQSTPTPIIAQEQVPKKKKGFRLLISIVIVVAILAIVAVLFLSHKNSTASTASTQKSSTPSTSADTSDSSLNNDLGNIQSSMNQTNTDQSSADNALNDSAQQITVPTE